jgi:hypothetical protein
MKNLLIYINPSHEWSEENKKLVKLQIDNSLSLGWKRKDILLITNFPYDYDEVISLVAPDELFCPYFPQASKINTILWMFENKLIGDDTYWFHDMEAFQNYPFNFELTKDLALTDYGYCERWNTGSFFFKKEARDIFQLIKNDSDAHQDGEEWALGRLTKQNIGNINDQYEVLNITYNFPGSVNAVRNFEMIYNKTDKPVLVPHFHPNNRKGLFYRVMTGENVLGVNVLSDRLIGFFNKYGWK